MCDEEEVAALVCDNGKNSRILSISIKNCD